MTDLMPQMNPMRRCGAKTRSGEPCRQFAMANGRCKMHGGLTPSGAASPHFKTGRYSKSLPARLQGRYAEAISDPHLLVLREEVSLLDARLSDLLARVDTGESGALWQALQAARHEALDANRRNDTAAQTAAINAVLGLIAQGHSDYQAWREIGNALDQRRRLVESERKRLVESQQMITSEKAMLLMAAIVGIVKQYVTDTKQLSAIANAIDALTTIEGDG